MPYLSLFLASTLEHQKTLEDHRSERQPRDTNMKKRHTCSSGCGLRHQVFFLCRNLTSSPPMISSHPQADVALTLFVEWTCSRWTASSKLDAFPSKAVEMHLRAGTLLRPGRRIKATVWVDARVRKSEDMGRHEVLDF